MCVKGALFVLLFSVANACSIMMPRGLAIESLSTNSSLRLHVADYDDEGVRIGQPTTLLVDFSERTIAVVEHASASSRPEQRYGAQININFGAASDMSGYTFTSLNDTLRVNGNGLTNATFTLPGLGSDGIGWRASSDQFWYSAAQARYFFVYEAANVRTLVVCVSPASCNAPVALGGGSGFYDPERSPVVYDEFDLVKLPLACCVCTTFEYYRFSEASVTIVNILNTIQPTAFDASTGTVYSVRTHTDGADGARTYTIESLALRSDVNTSIAFPEAELRAHMSRPLSTEVLVIIVVASALAVVLAICALVLWTRRRKLPSASKPGKHVMMDKA